MAMGSQQQMPAGPRASVLARPPGKAAPPKPAGKGAGANPLLDPTAVLSGPALQQAAGQIADAQTLGPITELARQIAQQQRQGAGAQKLTAGYFGQLGQQAAQGVAQEGQISAGLNQTLQGIANDTQQRLAQLGQGQSQALGGRVGGDFGTVAQAPLQAALGQQQGFAAQNAGTFRSAGALQGANYQGLAAANRGAFASRGQEDLASIARATRLAAEPLNSKIAGLRAERGALAATALGKLRTDERNYLLTRAGLGLKQQALQAGIAQDKARNALTLNGQQIAQMRADRLYQINLKKYGALVAQQKWADDPNAVGSPAWGRVHGRGSGSSTGTGKAPSPASQNVVVRRVSSVTARINELTSQFEHWGASPADAASQAWHALHTGTYWGKNPATGKWSWQYTSPIGDTGLLNAAYNVRNGGPGLSPGDVAYLKKQGLVNPGSRLSLSKGGPQTPATVQGIKSILGV